ncbi:MAG: hypothetical protein IH968_04215 [Gemmatimonadetes bacterium]|nr:hypothetical protein [Gemmatimonadota bacterium]
MSSPTKAATKRYLVHFGGAMLVYSGVVLASVWTINGLEVTGWRAGALSLLPMVPALYALHAFVVRFRAVDEFLRSVESEALLWGAGIVGFLSFGYGFLEGSINAPRISMIWVLPTLIATYGIIYRVLLWRAR